MLESTVATRQLFDNAGETITICEQNADRCAKLLLAVQSELESDSISALKGILKTTLIIDFINLDLCAAIRQYLSTELSAKYEKRQALTKINIVISEGYKKIYGFGKEQRNKSYWVNQIKKAVDFIGGLDTEYKNIEDKLHIFANSGVLNKNMRDLAVHYDVNPMEMHQMLSKLSADDVIGRCQTFTSLLNNITNFVWQLSEIMIKYHNLL